MSAYGSVTSPAPSMMEGVEYEDDLQAEFPEGQPLPLHSGWIEDRLGHGETNPTFGSQKGHRKRYSTTHMSIDSIGYQEDVKKSWERPGWWDSDHVAVTDHIQYVVQATYPDDPSQPEYYLYTGNYTSAESPNDEDMRDATPDFEPQAGTALELTGLSLATPTQAHFPQQVLASESRTPTQATFSLTDVQTPTQDAFPLTELQTPTQATFPPASALAMQAIPESEPLVAQATPPHQISPGASTTSSPRRSPTHPTILPISSPLQKSPTPPAPPTESVSLARSPSPPSPFATAVSPEPHATPPRQASEQAAFSSPVSHPYQPSRETTPPSQTPIKEVLSSPQAAQTYVASVDPTLHQATPRAPISQISIPTNQGASQQETSPPRQPHSVTPPPRVTGTPSGSSQGSPKLSPPRLVTGPPTGRERKVLVPRSRLQKSSIDITKKVTVKFEFPWSEISQGLPVEEDDERSTPGPSSQPRRQNSSSGKGKRRAEESPSRSPPPALPQPTPDNPSEPPANPPTAGKTRAASPGDEPSGSQPRRQKQEGEATLGGDPKPTGNVRDDYLGRYKGPCDEDIHVYKPLGLSEEYVGIRMQGFFSKFQCGDCKRGWRKILRERAAAEKENAKQLEQTGTEQTGTEQTEKVQPARNVVSVYFCLTCEKQICNFCCIKKYGSRSLPNNRDMIRVAGTGRR